MSSHLDNFFNMAPSEKNNNKNKVDKVQIVDITEKEKNVTNGEIIINEENKYMKLSKKTLVEEIEKLTIEKNNIMQYIKNDIQKSTFEKPKKETLRKNNLKVAFYLLEQYVIKKT